MYSAQQHLVFSEGAAGGIYTFTLSTSVDADQEGSRLERIDSICDWRGRAEAGRDVGESELTWTVATDILHWRAFV